MQVLDLAIVRKLVVDVVFGGFFVDICDQDYPSFDRYVTKRVSEKSRTARRG